MILKTFIDVTSFAGINIYKTVCIYRGKQFYQHRSKYICKHFWL